MDTIYYILYTIYYIGVIHKVSEAVGTPQWKRAFTKGAYLHSFFGAFINVAYTRFKVDKDIMNALVHLVA